MKYSGLILILILCFSACASKPQPAELTSEQVLEQLSEQPAEGLAERREKAPAEEPTPVRYPDYNEAARNAPYIAETTEVTRRKGNEELHDYDTIAVIESEEENESEEIYPITSSANIEIEEESNEPHTTESIAEIDSPEIIKRAQAEIIAIIKNEETVIPAPEEKVIQQQVMCHLHKMFKNKEQQKYYCKIQSNN